MSSQIRTTRLGRDKFMTETEFFDYIKNETDFEFYQLIKHYISQVNKNDIYDIVDFEQNKIQVDLKNEGIHLNYAWTDEDCALIFSRMDDRTFSLSLFNAKVFRNKGFTYTNEYMASIEKEFENRKAERILSLV